MLNPTGVLLLTGTYLASTPQSSGSGVVIEGTRNGSAVQRRIVRGGPSEMLLMPDQENPWNNEYTVTVNARYSEHGTLRTGTCSRKLRAPVTVTNLGHPNRETGILTGNADAPLVQVTGGSPPSCCAFKP